MRTVLLVVLELAICLASAAIAADRPTYPVKKEGGQAAEVDQLAQSIFSSADKNHNQILNKSEFRDAQASLEDALNDWGRQGKIGKGKKPANKDAKKSDDANVSHAPSTNKLAGSNKVSQAEFTFFAHSMWEEADKQWRELNTAAEAQRKAAAAQRRAMTPNRGRPRYPLPYGS